jgi:CHAD domain-containing protein
LSRLSIEDAAREVVMTDSALHPRKLELLRERTLDDRALEEAIGSAYAKARKTLLKRADDFTHDQSEENTHDVRTAIRRMDAALHLFPRKVVRTKKVKNVLKRNKRLLKETAGIRDMDIVRARILHDAIPRGAREELLRSMEKTRESHLAEAERLSRQVEKEKNLLPQRTDLESPKLPKRFEKVVRKTIERIEERLPEVLRDPSDVKELHRLRMDCKRLRYTLELMGAQHYTQQISMLTAWQDALGAVVDAEVTMDYVKKKKWHGTAAATRELLESQAKRRKESFERFLALDIKMPVTSTSS